MSNTAAAQMVSFSMMINKPGYQAMINRTIQDPARARRFISAITSAVSINPTLQECTPHTILSPPAPRRRRIPRKCSTCTDRSCRQRGRVCNWINCRSWKGGEQTDGK